MNTCHAHSGHEARITKLEADEAQQWTAIDETRRDIKALLIKIGTLVGGISILNTVVIGVVVYVITKGS